MRKLFVCLLSVPIIGKAQTINIPRDTSFTIDGTFIKEQKNFPFIRIANPPLSKSVSTGENIVYETIGSRQLHLDIFYPSVKNNG
ncbi:MAG: hypothetical protein ABIN89_04720 [Chitinophagaceae bacterium]